jgi:hypothetical protein
VSEREEEGRSVEGEREAEGVWAVMRVLVQLAVAGAMLQCCWIPEEVLRIGTYTSSRRDVWNNHVWQRLWVAGRTGCPYPLRCDHCCCLLGDDLPPGVTSTRTLGSSRTAPPSSTPSPLGMSSRSESLRSTSLLCTLVRRLRVPV